MSLFTQSKTKNNHHHKSTCNFLSPPSLFGNIQIAFSPTGLVADFYVPAGFQAVTVKCDLLSYSGTHFFSPLVARLLCHDSVGRLFMRVSNCVCGCRWCQSGCPVNPLPSHTPAAECRLPLLWRLLSPPKKPTQKTKTKTNSRSRPTTCRYVLHCTLVSEV